MIREKLKELGADLPESSSCNCLKGLSESAESSESDKK